MNPMNTMPSDYRPLKLTLKLGDITVTVPIRSDLYIQKALSVIQSVINDAVSSDPRMTSARDDLTDQIRSYGIRNK